MTRSILTVSELNRHVRAFLEHELSDVCVSGEISNVSKPSSGHYYFTLKDAGAQIRCVYFRNRYAVGNHNHVSLQNGQHVVAVGRLSLYEARGDYQLIIDVLNDAGEGDLYRQFEALKTKLAALGLFDSARKKCLPSLPSCIGVITSGTGAALQDILTTLARRFPLTPVRIYPSDVQGKKAVPQLIQALQRASTDKQCDVLILARGGGSIEDLWAFNEESLVFAMANSPIPIVTGIGHETDVTLADFAADHRAATPTAAAERVVPNWLDFKSKLQSLQQALLIASNRLIGHKRRYQLNVLKMRLQAQNPVDIIQKRRIHLHYVQADLLQVINARMVQSRQRFAKYLATLQVVSPLATLERGYAIALSHEQVLLDSHQVDKGESIELRLAKGTVYCCVEDVVHAK